jgi:uncharacterized protein YndB with AHSA1/START domain
VSDTLELTIEIAARRETVFGFLTDPELFKEWMGTASQMSSGATPSFSVPYPNGDQAVGEVVEAVAPERVVYSWGYRDSKNGMAPGSTRVVIELAAIDTGTRLSLRHLGIPTEEVRKAHLQGWRYYFGLLAARAADHQTQKAVHSVLAAWERAWNFGDAEAIEHCCAEGVAYSDRMARVQGSEELLQYIRNARAFAPAARLEVAGLPSVTQQFVRFDWSMQAGEHSIGKGIAFAEVGMDGRFTRVVSFWR